MTELERQHNAHKERVARINGAAWKPQVVVKVEPPTPLQALAARYAVAEQVIASLRAEVAALRAIMASESSDKEPRTPGVKVDLIKKVVADHYGINMLDLISHRKPPQLVRVRQIAIHLCRVMTSRSLPDIGRHFGGRDHTTIIYADRKMSQLRADDAATNDELNLLRQKIIQVTETRKGTT